MHLELPPGWAARRFRASSHMATLHAGDFPLADPDGEFGERSAAQMPGVASFLALIEYLPGSGHRAGAGPFAAPGPRLPLDPVSFSAERFVASRPGQVAAQQLFTAAGRAFCLYLVVAGPRTARRRQLLVLDQVLRSLDLSPRAE